MELCQGNLETLLKQMNSCREEKFKIMLYFISCELFRELTECVHYLHSLSPPIIHRDLKPENVLISDGSNGRALKLCDFGLATEHEYSEHSQMIGTQSYMAPEVMRGQKYNIKSDIYSLSLIATQIFNFGENVRRIRNKSDL